MFIPLKQRDTIPYSLLFVFLLVVGCGGPERVALRGGTEHLLLLHRRTLRYVERMGSEERRFTIRMFYSGGRAVREYELQVKGLDLGHCRLISKDQQVFFETNKPATALADVPEFRQLWVDEAVSPGDSWEDSDTGTETVVASPETVTVPAGTYADCYKTVTAGTPVLLDSLTFWHESGALKDEIFAPQMAAAQTVVVRWFASGVGLVKVQFGDPEHVWELTAVAEAGTGRVDIETPQEQEEE
jgi:hypothetical protein